MTQIIAAMGGFVAGLLVTAIFEWRPWLNESDTLTHRITVLEARIRVLEGKAEDAGILKRHVSDVLAELSKVVA